MSSELQSLVDSLARRLRRSVAVDDPRFRLLAHSSHFGESDSVRRIAILERNVPDELADWAAKWSVSSATGPVRISGNPEWDLKPRLCIPVRSEGSLFGYVWLIDEPAVPDDEAAMATQAAGEMGMVLLRERLRSELAVSAEGALARDVLSHDAAQREYAAAQLVDGDFIVAGPCVAMVARPYGPNEDVDESARLAVAAALDDIRREISPRGAIYLLRHDHGLAIVSGPMATRDQEQLMATAEKLVHALEKRLDRTDWRVVVGIGDVQENLAKVVTSYEHAVQAVRAGRMIDTFGQVVRWSDLGVYRLLLHVPPDRLMEEVLPAPLLRLLEKRSGGNDRLLETLEIYLDLAGDARATAEALCLHRATLYYRIRRIEELTGADLSRGQDRLALHLGCKIARLTGVLPLHRDIDVDSIQRDL